MTRFATLTEALEHNCSDHRRITYIAGEQSEREVSFSSLYQRALGLLGHLQGKGLRRGDELIIFLSSQEQFIDAFWACLFGNIVPVPVGVGINDAHRHKLVRIFKTLANPHLYTDSRTLNRLASFAAENELNDELSQIRQKTVLVDQIHDVSEAGRPAAANSDDIAFIQFSSGSTSDPKGVMLTHRNIVSNIYAIIEGAHLTEQDVTLSWMPLTHDMGLIGFHLTVLVRNMNHHLMPTDLFIRRPLLWLRKVSEKKANVLCSPNFGYKHVLKVFSERKSQDIDLSHVRLIFNGAEPISVPLCEQFLSQMAPYGLKRSAMFTVYGLAEASLAVTFPEAESGYKVVHLDRNTLSVGQEVQFAPSHGRDTVSLVSVGRVVSGCEVSIADEENIMQRPGVMGHILIRGDNVTQGYFRNEAANRATFRRDGWLDTGDLGFVTSQGELVIAGRSKDVIFVNGQNYYPQDLESIAEKVDPLELGKVAVSGVRRPRADSDDLVVFVIFKGPLEGFIDIAHQIALRINQQTGLQVTHVIPVKRIPKTTSGKIQRHLLADAYAQGEYSDVLAALQRLSAVSKLEKRTAHSAIEATLQQICANVIGDISVRVNDNLFEVGASSLDLARIHEGIEEAFPGKVDITDLFEYPTIAELAGYLQKKIA